MTNETTIGFLLNATDVNANVAILCWITCKQTKQMCFKVVVNTYKHRSVACADHCHCYLLLILLLIVVIIIISHNCSYTLYNLLVLAQWRIICPFVDTAVAGRKSWVQQQRYTTLLLHPKLQAWHILQPMHRNCNCARIKFNK